MGRMYDISNVITLYLVLVNAKNLDQPTHLIILNSLFSFHIFQERKS